MATPGVNLGVRTSPYDSSPHKGLVQRFAASTGDPNPSGRNGDAVPIVALMTQAWPPQVAARDMITSKQVKETATGGAHAEHDIVVHRPLVVGERLRTWAEAWGSRPAGGNAFVTHYYRHHDMNDELVAEQWWTTVFLNGVCSEAGRPVPDHRFPEDARARKVATYEIHLSEELPRRWAEATEDWAAIHFDMEKAKTSGFTRLAAHGLSTLATCTQGIVEQLADGDHARLRRVACRFASPTYVDEDLRVFMYEAGPRTYAFEADCAGAKVITHGLAELRAS